MPEGSGSFRGIAIRQPVNIVVAAEVSPLIGETGFRRKGLRVAEGATRAQSEISSDYKPGDHVSHRVFGKGTVLRVYRDEATGNDKIDINFDEKGQKTLLLTYAKLERLS